MKYLQSNFRSISEIHPLSPIFTLQINKSSNGMTHHIKLFCYDFAQNTVVDISQLIADNIDKKTINGGIKLRGTGMNMHQLVADEFKNNYKKLTGLEFSGKLERTNFSEKHLFSNDVNDFLSLKENLLKYAKEEQKNNAQYVYDIVKNCGCAVQYASDSLKNNKRIALAAINDDHSSLRYLGNKIKDDEAYVRLSLEKNINAFLWASQRIIKAIGNNDPKSYLDSVLLHEKLTEGVTIKPTTNKMKI